MLVQTIVAMACFHALRLRVGAVVGGLLLGLALVQGVRAAEASAPVAAPGQALRVITDDNFPPYVFRGTDGQVQGYLVDLWALWQAHTGTPVVLMATNWAEAQRRLLAGQADLIDLIYKTPARESQYAFSAPWVSVPWASLPVAIFGHESIVGITDVAALKGFRVGVQAGDACIDELRGGGITDLAEYPNYRSLIDAARRNDIKLFCLDRDPANFYLYQAGAQHEFRQAFVLYEGQLHRAVRPGNEALLQQVEAGMNGLPQADLDRLRERWFSPSPSGPAVPYLRQAIWVLGGALVVAGLLVLWNLALHRRVAARTAALRQALDELAKAHATALAAQQDLEAMLAAIPDLLFEFDAQGVCRDLFARDENLLAAPRQSQLGHHVQDTLPAEAAATVLDSLAAAAAHGQDAGRCIALDLGGARRWFELSTTRRPGGTGEDARFLILSRDVTSRRAAEQEVLRLKDAALQAERDRHFRQLFDSAPVAMAVLRAGFIVLLNRRFLSTFGYPRDELVRLDDWWQRAFPDPAYLAQVKANSGALVRQAAAGDGVIETMEVTIKPRDGGPLTMLLGGQVLGEELIFTFTDVTELRRVAQALRLASDEAESANRAKSSFLANMSHELRTPMNAIIGFSHLLKRSALSAEQAQRVDRIARSGQHLLALIDDVLDISKIEAGSLDVEQIEVDVPAVLGFVEASIRERANAKGLTLQVHCHARPERCLGDPTRLRQCLLNLAGNAVKFTDRGSITLTAREMAHTDSDVLLRFEVRDTGMGIEPQLQADLFKPFQQADASISRRFGGTGLGLSLTRQLARAMGGDAGMHSGPRQGSTFWFSARLRRQGVPMPALAAPSEPMTDEAVQAGEFTATGHRAAQVLLVEDNPANQLLAQELLSAAGYRVSVAGNGAEAVERLRAAPVDLVLMDMQMPVMDGLQAAAAIRRLPGRQSVPIIAMTANAFAEDRQACLQAGMNDFLPKPVDPEVLYATLARWLALEARPAATLTAADRLG